MKNEDILIRLPGLDGIRNFSTGEIIINDALIQRDCPLCNGKGSQRLGKVDIFPILKCNNCNMIYNPYYPNSRYTLSSIDTQVPRHYDMKKAKFSDKFFGGKSLLERVFLRNSGKHINNINFLDFGCGQGWLVRAAKELGWNAYGVDSNDNQRKLAKDLYDIQVYKKMEDIENSISFEFVAMNHVLSVLNNPLDVLVALYKRTKYGGLIYIADPNIDSYSVKRDGVIHYYFTPPRINHFTKETLCKMLFKAGFSKIVMCREGRLEFYIFFPRTKKTLQYFHKNSLKPVSGLPYDPKIIRIFERPFYYTREILKRIGFSFIENIGLGDEIRVVAQK